MGKKILIVAMVLLFGAAALFAHDITGRDFTDSDELIVLKGTLRYESPEWYLDTEDGSYLLHFGNRDYLESTGIQGEDGKDLSVEGFVRGNDVLVASAAADGKVYSFRDNDGVPFWAGRGKRFARNGDDGCGPWAQSRGMGRRSAGGRTGLYGPRAGRYGSDDRPMCR